MTEEIVPVVVVFLWLDGFYLQNNQIVVFSIVFVRQHCDIRHQRRRFATSA